jgi:hypothetical protein
MHPGLLSHWTSNPKSLLGWGEAFLAFKRCPEALPWDTEDLVTTDMLTAKKRFQRQAQDARTPARALFPEKDDKTEGFVEVPTLATPSPFKPSVSTMSISGKSTEIEKGLAHLIRRVETGLESPATHNLIQNRTIIKDQDKSLRGLESRLDTVQDQVGETPLGLAWEFDAPTLNSRVDILAEKVSTLKPAEILLETQVLSWVDAWWAKSALPAKIKAADDFLAECEIFLTSLVTSFQKQAGEVSSLATRVNVLATAAPPAARPSQALGQSAFATLQHLLGLGSTTGAGLSNAPPNPSANVGVSQGSSSATIQAVQAATISALELRMRVLDNKFTQLSTNSASSTIKFGGAGFSSPRDVMPLIQARMSTSYFGCFVNAAILLEWIQGNSSEDTLKNMERMHKLKDARRDKILRRAGAGTRKQGGSGTVVF